MEVKVRVVIVVIAMAVITDKQISKKTQNERKKKRHTLMGSDMMTVASYGQRIWREVR